MTSLNIFHSTQHSRLLVACLLVLLLGVVGSGRIGAETVEIPIGQQGKNLEIKLPRSGMKQHEVEAAYGRPLNSTPAVGSPPISSWIYADFVVYFEHDHVVHAVIIHRPQTDVTPADSTQPDSAQPDSAQNDSTQTDSPQTE